jgi:hypothetical protein
MKRKRFLKAMHTRTFALLVLLAVPVAALAQAPAQDAPRWRMPRFGSRSNEQPAQPAPAQAAPAEAPAQLPPPPPVAENTPRPRREPRAEETKRPQRPRPTPKAEEPKATPKPSRKATEPEETPDLTTQKIDAATSAVGDFLKEANNGFYSKAALYLTPQLQKYFDSEMSAPMGGLTAALDRVTREGTIRLVRYSNWRGRGELGRIDAEITFASGQAEKRVFDLVKIDGKWRLQIPVDGGGASPTTPSAAPAPPAATPAPPPPDASSPVATPERPSSPQASASSTPKPVEAFAKIDAAIRAEADASTQSALSDAPWKAGN